MQKLKAFLFKLTGLRISLAIAVVFLVAHAALESDLFKTGFFSKGGFLYRLEYSALDAKFLARKVPFEPKVVVAAADEKSTEKYGLWPWNRKRIAELIDRLTEAGVASIGFDIIFADEDKNSTFRELTRFKDIYDESGLYRKVQPALLGQALERVSSAIESSRGLEPELKTPGAGKKKLSLIAKSLGEAQLGLQAYEEKSQRFYDIMTEQVKSISPDEALARSVRQSRRVVLGYFAFTNPAELVGLAQSRLLQNFERVKRSGSSELYDSVQGAVSHLAPPEFKIDELAVPDAVGVQAPLPIIAEASEHFALFNVLPDPDKIIRGMPLFYRMNGMLLPTLGLQSTAVAYGGGFSAQVDRADTRWLEGVWLNDYQQPGEAGASRTATFIPTTENGIMLINYYADPMTTIPTLSISDIIDRKVDAAMLKGKVILVGATAIGTYDLRANPYHTSPGVYIQAAAAQNIMDRTFLRRLSLFPLIEGFFLLLIGLLAGLVVPRIRISLGFGAVVGLIVGIFAADNFFVFGSGYWMRTVAPVVELLFIFVAVTVFRFLTEEREKRVIRKAFQFYLSKAVVDSVLKDTSKLKLGGEKKDLTVLFSDIRGFTTISERLSPEDLVHLLNDYLTPMTDLVFHHEGTLDKYMGDAVMAFWGAPVDQTDHATKACTTALNMMSKLRVMQEQWREKGLPEIDIGIGLNSGPMAVGNMGSAARFDYTVMGDNVNLGSRLEGINKEYGTNIIISEFTLERAKNDVYVRWIDAVRVKGKHEPVRIYELRGLGRPQGAEDKFITSFERGLELYRGQKWDEAIQTFRDCLAIVPTDHCSDMYIKRCSSMKEEPPGQNWDGVYTMKHK